MHGVDISPVTGDYNQDQNRKRVKASKKIIGDAVKTYLEHCRGMKGITFAVDVEHAEMMCDEFNRAGVRAQVVTAETNDADRLNFMRQLKNGELLMLVNVDLFGEGVDVPAVEVVIMARPTASYGLFAQQFGRALRLLISPVLHGAWDSYAPAQRLRLIAESTKPRAYIIDLVGNIITHMGPPDMRKIPWSLDARVKGRKATDGIPLRACANPVCLQPYERIYPACPYCGMEPAPPKEPTRPEHVDGDVVLYTAEMLEALFGAIRLVDDSNVPIPYGMKPELAAYKVKLHRDKQETQRKLRGAMELVMPPGMNSRVAQRRFFHTFGIDTLTAQALGSAEAEQLRQRILAKVTIP